MNTIMKELRLKDGETIISKEVGNSMVPLIRSRQSVKLTPCTYLQVKKGDIVYCRVHGKHYTHLVKAVNPKRGCLITNANGHENGWTRNIYGKVTKIL
jgi:hypothetical protein